MQLSQSKDSWLFLLMFMMLIAGASNVLLKEFMALMQAPIGVENEFHDFNRPVMWSLLMKAGMSLCLLFHLKMPEAPLRVFVLSCGLGLLTDILVNCAYCAIAGSAIQMLRGGKILFTASLSYFFLGRRLQPYQLFGASMVCVGISLVGVSAHLTPAQRRYVANIEDQEQANWIAMGCCFLGEVSQAVLWVYQESVLKTYDIHPLQLVGIEGTIGLMLGTVVVVIAHHLAFENMHESMYQLAHSIPLLVSVVALLVSMAIFNYAGVGVTKQGSAVARSVIDVSRSVVIWVAELFLHWHQFSWFQLGGFSVLVLGALAYNNILPVPRALQAHDETMPIAASKKEKASA
eukprot:CAMPEP_0178431692 /NCGR_PEP_ID=MMETSP0689_2-20121128/31989_1 /TAXON_ID=160604 /ORGANISM="Amphidinium massartii, Strain CS-259" /LENGTH=346 /DNA_ID=CAMNT_0020053633 /DNA_START=92 /DNA_END=1132 /DNA_ORIENTATION=+